MLLLKLLINFEISLGYLISEVNFNQPSLLAVIIALLYTLLSEVYKSLPVGFLFLASFLHFERRIVRFSSHHGGYLYFLLKIFLGIVLVRVAVRIFKKSLNFSSIEVAVQYLALHHLDMLHSSFNWNKFQLPLWKFQSEALLILKLGAWGCDPQVHSHPQQGRTPLLKYFNSVCEQGSYRRPEI